MSLNQFKWLDLFIFSILAVIFEVINHFANIGFSDFKLIFMSFGIVLTLISIYRWGFAGSIVIIFSSLIAVVVSEHKNNYAYYITYIVGGFFGITLGYLIFQLGLGRERLKNKMLLCTYLVCDFIFVILLRSLISTLFNISTFTKNLQYLCIQEAMSVVVSILILLVAARKKGNIVVEMKQYTKSVKDSQKLGNLKELKESSKFNSDKPFTEFNEIDEGTILDGGVMNIDQLNELSKMYQESDKIIDKDPIDILSEKNKVD